MSAGPYQGLSVLECGNGTACAFAGQLLADRGAAVTKVEPPEGDSLRWRDAHRHAESKAFQWLCRGKRSIVVDDDTDAGREVLNRLAGIVDIVLTNWPLSRLQRAGLDPAALCKAHPRLVFLNGSKFGAGGEWAERPANDLVMQAFTGMLASEGKRRDDDAPDEIRCCEITQFPAGVMMAMGVAAALFHREQSGRGQIVETSELGAALIIQGGRVGRNTPDSGVGDAARQHLAAARSIGASYSDLAAPFGPPNDPVSNAGRCFYRAYTTADGGAVFLGALSKPLRAKVRSALGIDFLLRDDPDFDPEDPALHAKCIAFLDQVVSDMGSRTTAEWLETLERHGVPSGEVTFPEDLGACEQARVNGYVVEVEHPVDGVQLHVAPPAHFGCQGDPEFRPAPCLGEHTEMPFIKFDASKRASAGVTRVRD